MLARTSADQYTRLILKTLQHMSASAPARSIEFHNTTLGATIAVLQAAEPATLADALHKMLGGMPDFFNGETVILDFANIAQMPARIDWAGLHSLLRRYRLQPIGVLHLAEAHHDDARRSGLALIDSAQLLAKPPAEAPARVAPRPAPAQKNYVLRGFFLLPRAFTAGGLGEDRDMLARSFAAWRELEQRQRAPRPPALAVCHHYCGHRARHRGRTGRRPAGP